MALDEAAARAAGYTDDEIAAYKANQTPLADRVPGTAPATPTGFDMDGARAAGYSDDEIEEHLKKRGLWNPNRPDGSHQPTNDDIYAAVKDAAIGLPQKVARIGSDAAFALPNMAGDFGVGVRNLYGKLTGGQSDFQYPSDSYRRGMDAVLPGSVPKGKAEALEMALGPVVVGSGASRVPALVRALQTPAIAADASQIPTAAPGTAPESFSMVFGGGTPELGTKGGGTAGPVAQVPPSFMDKAQTAKLAAGLKAEKDARELKEFQDAGFVVPPSTSNPTAGNQTLETIGSKIGTQQNASVRNAATAQRLAARANGLNDTIPIGDQLPKVRAEAGKAYDRLSKAGRFDTDKTFLDQVQDIHDGVSSVNKDFPDAKVSPVVNDSASLSVDSMDSSNAIKMIRRMRDEKSAAYKNGDTESGKAYGNLADALEDQMDRAMQVKAQDPKSGITPDMVDAYRTARQRIAIAHSTEDALEGGEVSIKKLVSAYRRGDPLSGDLETIARFGDKYDKASQSPGKIGSAGVNHLEGFLGGGGSLVGAVEGYHKFGVPGAIGGAAIGPAYSASRRAAINYLLSPRGQRGAIPNVPDVSALQDLGPTRAKAAALAQGLASLEP